MHRTGHRVPDATEITEIAHAAIAHEHTVTRRLLGLPVRGQVADRIDRELARRGYIAEERRAS